MEEYGLFKLQFKFPHIFGTLVFNVDVNEHGIATDPGLAMETSRHLDRLGVEFLRQIQLI